MADFGLVSGSERIGSLLTTSATPISAGAKSAWAELTPGLSSDCTGLILEIRANDGFRRHLIDIAVGAAGSEQIILADFGISILDGYSGYKTLRMPIPVKAGSRIAFRVQSNAANEAVYLDIFPILGHPFSPMQIMHGAVDTLGVVSASTVGTNLTPANTWVELSPATPNRYRAFMYTLSSAGNNTTHAGTTVSIGIGALGSEVTLTAFNHVHRLACYDFYPQDIPFIQADIPAGTRLVAKASDISCPVHVIFYGVR